MQTPWQLSGYHQHQARMVPITKSVLKKYMLNDWVDYFCARIMILKKNMIYI